MDYQYITKTINVMICLSRSGRRFPLFAGHRERDFNIELHERIWVLPWSISLGEERRIKRIDKRLVQIATVLMTRSSGCALCWHRTQGGQGSTETAGRVAFSLDSIPPRSHLPCSSKWYFGAQWQFSQATPWFFFLQKMWKNYSITVSRNTELVSRQVDVSVLGWYSMSLSDRMN